MGKFSLGFNALLKAFILAFTDKILFFTLAMFAISKFAFFSLFRTLNIQYYESSLYIIGFLLFFQLFLDFFFCLLITFRVAHLAGLSINRKNFITSTFYTFCFAILIYLLKLLLQYILLINQISSEIPQDIFYGLMLFVGAYLIPIIVFENRNIFYSLKQSVKIMCRMFGETLMLIVSWIVIMAIISLPMGIMMKLKPDIELFFYISKFIEGFFGNSIFVSFVLLYLFYSKHLSVEFFQKKLKTFNS